MEYSLRDVYNWQSVASLPSWTWTVHDLDGGNEMDPVYQTATFQTGQNKPTASVGKESALVEPHGGMVPIPSGNAYVRLSRGDDSLSMCLSLRQILSGEIESFIPVLNPESVSNHQVC